MRVLWFSINSACYVNAQNAKQDIDRGWISSLEKIIKKEEGIELGIAFEYKHSKFKEIIDGVTYYPISVCQTSIEHYVHEFTLKNEEKKLIPKAIEVIDDFKPDIIQCFGSEWCYGLIATKIKIPVVIHMQGSMPTYYNVLYPPRYNKYTRLWYDLIHFRFKDLIRDLNSQRLNRQRTEREFRILKMNKYFLGRTEWDKSITRLLSPNCRYFTCNEALRDSFYYSKQVWNIKNRDEIIICTTGSGSLWKGLDVILKTADILSHRTNFKFKWKLIGGKNNIGYIEWMEKLHFSECNVEFLGILKEEQLKNELLNCDFYVHPAYIDNSPNALCEAMILGCPCIASHVGGVPSILEHGISGEIVPVNEPYYLAERIIELANDREKQERYSLQSIASARKRHNIENIKKELLDAYQQILSKSTEFLYQK